MDITFCFALVALLGWPVQSTIILQNNGYSGVLVAISEDEPMPEDGGTEFIDNLKDVLTETSAALYTATNQRAYLKDIEILVPSKWTRPISGTPPQLTYTESFEGADIRLTVPNEASGITLPYTKHSGHCGVPGDYIQVPIDFLTYYDEANKVKAKALVQQWAQFRYGVFEEHGYPGDIRLPYFYRHPEGYDAVTTSNDTEIVGNLETLDGEACSVSDGIISNPDDCRFMPSLMDQTATRSLMAFHWIDSITGFSDAENHDKRPPHRQNRWCGSRSSWEVILESPDFTDGNPPGNPGMNTNPTFVIKRNVMKPVIMMMIDTSFPSTPDNAGSQAVGILKRGLLYLTSVLSSTNQDTYIGLYTFQGPDEAGPGQYLKEVVAPVPLGAGRTQLDDAINALVQSSNVFTRSTPAALRDGISRLAKYKDVGGSIMYIITSTVSDGSETLFETDVAQMLLRNNIKLVVGESGNVANGGQSLARVSVLAQGYYLFRPKFDASTFFTPLATEVLLLTEEILSLTRRTLVNREEEITSAQSWSGHFFIDETIGNDTVVALVTPLEDLFTITITAPDGVETEFTSGTDDTNWSAFETNIGLVSRDFPNAAVGQWNYAIRCEPCVNPVAIHLQVTSSPSGTTTVKLDSWVSLSAGTNTVDASKHPLILSARFDSTNGPLAGLSVTAEITKNSKIVDRVLLTDSGSLVSDVARDGIYGGIFYPSTDGEYTVNVLAEGPSTRTKPWNDRLLLTDQDSYCCGSSLSTFTLPFFQSYENNAVSFQVIRTDSAQPALPPIVADLQAKTYGVENGRVYVELTWTEPPNILSQIPKYSENEDDLSIANIDMALEAQLEFGSLAPVMAGSPVFVYVSTPHSPGKNVFLAIQTTSSSGETASQVVWTDKNPPDNVFTSPLPTSSTVSFASTSTENTTPSSTSESTPTDSTVTDSTATDSTVTDTTQTDTTLTDTTTGSTTTQSSTTQSTTTQSSTTENTTTQSSTTESTTTQSSTTESTTTQSSTTESTTTQSSTTDSTTTQSSTTGGSTTTQSSTTGGSTTESSTSTDATLSTESTTTTGTVPSTKPPPTGLTPEEIGIIVGCSVGGVILIGILTGTIVYCKNRKKSNRPSRPVVGQQPIPRPAIPVQAPYIPSQGDMKVYRQPATQYTSKTTSSTAMTTELGQDNLGLTIEDDEFLLTAL